VADVPGNPKIAPSSLSAVSALLVRSRIQLPRVPKRRCPISQLGIAEQGQVTDRYNAAITNLGSAEVDIRLGGIYALQRIMQDSPRDQPAVVDVLTAFVRDHAHGATASPHTFPVLSRPPTDIQAAMTVVALRDTTYDTSTAAANFTGVDFSGMYLVMEYFRGAGLGGADLSGANLASADLTRAYLGGAYLNGANLNGANLNGANLNGAYLTGTKGLPPGIPRSPTSSTPASQRTYAGKPRV
jgi:hypothetical protein